MSERNEWTLPALSDFEQSIENTLRENLTGDPFLMLQIRQVQIPEKGSEPLDAEDFIWQILEWAYIHTAPCESPFRETPLDEEVSLPPDTFLTDVSQLPNIQHLLDKISEGVNEIFFIWCRKAADYPVDDKIMEVPRSEIKRDLKELNRLYLLYLLSEIERIAT